MSRTNVGSLGRNRIFESSRLRLHPASYHWIVDRQDILSVRKELAGEALAQNWMFAIALACALFVKSGFGRATQPSAEPAEDVPSLNRVATIQPRTVGLSVDFRC